MNKIKMILVSFLSLALFSSPVYAITGNLNVGASAIGACTIVSVTDIDFGVHQQNAGGGTFVSGDITVNCQAGTPYDVTLDGGQQTDGNMRFLLNEDGITLAMYDLGSPLWGQWGDNGVTIGAPSLAGFGTGADEILTIDALLNDNLFAPGIYSDTVVINVNF